MNPQTFVESLVIAVHEAGVSDVVTTLLAPAGRQPKPQALRLAAWYAGLSESDRESLKMVLENAVHAALFGTLCVLDGVRSIRSGSEVIELHLNSVEGEAISRINDPNEEFLHDIFQGIVYERVFGS